VLERGRIVETGRHDELVESKGLYYAMWRQQIGERRGAETAPAGLRSHGSASSGPKAQGSGLAATPAVTVPS
jgi:hypothetical protein